MRRAASAGTGALPGADRPGGGRRPPVPTTPPMPRDIAIDEPRRQEAPPLLVQRHDAARRARRSRARSSLPAPPPVQTMLCQKELAAFADDAAGDVVVACTQEARLFGDVAEEGGRTQTIRFVNIRETGGWSAEATAATPKIAALLALAGLPEPEPVPRVAYRSEGQLLIVGPADAALHWARRAVRRSSRSPCSSPAARSAPSCRPSAQLPGLLGRAHRRSPAGSARSTSRGRRRIRSTSTFARAATRACGPAPRTRSTGATRSTSTAARRIARAWPPAARSARSTSRARDVARSERFDLVLDLQRTPPLRMHQPPQGYLAPGADPVAQASAVAELAALVGEFEKPKYLHLQGVDLRAQPLAEDRLQPVHRRLLDRGDPRRRRPRRVEPHLCMGCGACATVCPSGAMTLRLSVGARPRRRGCARCSRPTRRPAGATRASCCTPRTAATRSRASRAAAAGCRRA